MPHQHRSIEPVAQHRTGDGVKTPGCRIENLIGMKIEPQAVSPGDRHDVIECTIELGIRRHEDAQDACMVMARPFCHFADPVKLFI